jgi:hypothetical protein
MPYLSLQSLPPEQRFALELFEENLLLTPAGLALYPTRSSCRKLDAFERQYFSVVEAVAPFLETFQFLDPLLHS